MPGHHRRHQITDAITGRRAGLIAAQLERESNAAESGDINHAASKAQKATDAAWPPKQEGEED